MRFSIAKLLLLFNSIRVIPVEYNYTLHNYLKQVQIDYYADANSITPFKFEANNNTRVVDLVGTHFKPLGSHYLMRDTMDKSIHKIIKFRLRQEPCFNEFQCSNTSFNYFTSCLKTLDGVFENQKECSWSYAYLPLIKHHQLKAFACVILNKQGRFVPEPLKNKQKLSFWCYSNLNWQELANDVYVS